MRGKQEVAATENCLIAKVNHLFPKENPHLLEEGVWILLNLFPPPTQPKDVSMQYHVSLMRIHFIYYAFEEPM